MIPTPPSGRLATILRYFVSFIWITGLVERRLDRRWLANPPNDVRGADLDVVNPRSPRDIG